VFRLAEHIERLFYSAKLFGMTIPHTPEEMTSAVHEVIQKNNLTECYIRPIAYIGYGNLGFDISKIKVEAGVAAALCRQRKRGAGRRGKVTRLAALAMVGPRKRSGGDG
jgi:branched-subunit amino acid aminotransferase/4-amino-4-deoxychorismate lyase